MAGRICLVNSVITSSLIHSFMVYKWPLRLIKYMEKAIRNFVWTGSVISKKLVVVPWNQCCSPKAEGGLGIKNLSLLNSALLHKLAGSIMAKDGLIFIFFGDGF